MKKFIFKGMALSGLLALMGGYGLNSVVHAEESASDHVKDAGTDLKKDSQKSMRKMKRHGRKATGNDNVGKDAKDKVNDAADDINATATKTKRKLSN